MFKTKIKNSISNDDYEKARYVIEENERVKLFSEAIQVNNINKLGKLLYQSHEGLSENYKVSCSELDFFPFMKGISHVQIL